MALKRVIVNTGFPRVKTIQISIRGNIVMPCSHQSLNMFRSCLVKHGLKFSSRQIMHNDFCQLQI